MSGTTSATSKGLGDLTPINGVEKTTYQSVNPELRVLSIGLSVKLYLRPNDLMTKDKSVHEIAEDCAGCLKGHIVGCNGAFVDSGPDTAEDVVVEVTRSTELKDFP